MLFVACADGVVRQYTQDKRTAVRGYPSVGDWSYALAVDEAHHRLAAGTYGGRVHVWDIETGKETASFTAAPGYKAATR
jgi:hypothetical protein